MFNVDKKKHLLFLKRNEIKATLNFHPENGMMFQRQLPEYIQYLVKNGESIFRTQDKKLLLIGGACSEIRRWLDEVKIPVEITNIDFYCEKNSSVSHQHIKADFYDWSIRTNYYDQEWALWSLPAYTFSQEEVEMFFIKAVMGLSPGGILRVFPLNRGPGDMGNSSVKYTNEERLSASINILELLQKLGFNIQKIYPNEMISVFENTEKNPNLSNYLVPSLMQSIPQERIEYVKNELINYQTKPAEKAPILVIITAPNSVENKKLVNKELMKITKNIYTKERHSE